MKTDFTVIGSGLAGLTSALVLQDFGKVLIVTKSKLADSATNLAQGGIAAVTADNDSFGSHIEDTLAAGVYHNNKKAVEYMVSLAPDAIGWLVKQGVCFDKKNGNFNPTREAAHSQKRILHAQDFTGREIETRLAERAKQSANILIWENCFALKLLVKDKYCYGVQVIKNKKVINYFSRAVILSTGGLGQVYKWTTNPDVATGDGIALAYWAGAKVKDMEFIQFHPTALKDGQSPFFLLSEALRGEGAILVRTKDRRPKTKDILAYDRFMGKYDERLELAPRDIVARAIYKEQQEGYEIFLDIRHKGKEFLEKRFPNISAKLLKRGFDLSRDLIPVTPAAHYSCGGVEVDLYGRTNIKNLFAFGEVACTGVHGANRLASNSLLESVVFPLRLKDCFSNSSTIGGVSFASLRTTSEVSLSNVVKTPERWPVYPERSRRGLLSGEFLKVRKNLQQLMWEKVGILRTKKGLEEALENFRKMEKELTNIQGTDIQLAQIQNMVLVAKLIILGALNRTKSLGAHFMD